MIQKDSDCKMIIKYKRRNVIGIKIFLYWKLFLSYRYFARVL